MEGFGVHTFRLVNARGETSLVKFHWKPVAGVHSLVWEEAQITAGIDPDFHRRDMADGIEAGAFLEWELGIQVMPDDGTDSFEGIDLLDPTKLVPEELAPVQLIGKLTLNRNPTNYFAETEQVAFHTGNLVPGIEVTNDPLMQARLFSYLDTQLTRLGGPNFTQLPINRAALPGQRHAARRNAPDRDPRRPRARTGPTASTAASRWCAAADEGGYVQTPRPVEGTVVRASPASFDDHFSQATHVLPQPDPDRAGPHRRGVHLRARQVLRAGDQGARTARCWPTSTPTCARRSRPASACPRPTAAPADDVVLSPALSQVDHRARARSPAGRSASSPTPARTSPRSARSATRPPGSARRSWSSRRSAASSSEARTSLTVDRTLLTTRSIEFDAVVVAGRHHPDQRHQAGLAAAGGVPALKTVGAWGDATAILEAAGIADRRAGCRDRRRGRPVVHGRAGRGRRAAPGVGPGRVGDVVGRPAVGLTQTWDRDRCAALATAGDRAGGAE